MRSSLSMAERREVFEELHRLRLSGQDLDLPALCRALATKYPRIPSRMTLRRWISGETAPSTSMNSFTAEPSEELSFFVGAWLGDGWGDQSDGGKRLLLKVRSRGFAEEFARSATRVLNKANPYKVRRVVDSNGEWYLVKVTSLLLFDFVNRPFQDLMPYLEKFPRSFLRSFFTAEGNPGISLSRKNAEARLSVALCVSNTTRQYMDFARSKMLELGYHPTAISTGYREGKVHPIRGVQYVSKATEWQFQICRLVEVSRFLSDLGFADPIKQEKASDAAFLIREHGPRISAVEWQALYRKHGRKWVKEPQTAVSSV